MFLFRKLPANPWRLKKRGFPWKKTLAGTALAASVATNGYLMYKSDTPPTVLSLRFPCQQHRHLHGFWHGFCLNRSGVITNASYTPEQLQALYGTMVGKELETMEKENANFDPRGTQGNEIDTFTSSMIEGLIKGQSQNTYDSIISQNPDLKYIVDSLISNQVVITPMAKYLDEKLAGMKDAIESLVSTAFPTKPKT